MKDLAARIAALPPEKRAQLEAHLRKSGMSLPPTNRIPRRSVSEAESTQRIPLSFAQQRLWFLDQLESNNPAYNIPVAFRFTGKLNVAALESSLVEIVRRHQTLRTSFVSDGNEPIAVITPEVELTLPIVDVQNVPAPERESHARQLAEEEARRPFRLDCSPLLRVLLIRLAPQEHVLVLTLHHIAGDGWSLGVLTRELGTIYQAFTNNKPSPLPELPIEYSDYVLWQRDTLQDTALEQGLAFWTERLHDAPLHLDLITDYPRPPAQSYEGARHSLQLSPALSQKLQELSRQHGTTLFTTLLAAFATLLHSYRAGDDLVLGSPFANRNYSEVEDLIGYFVNTLPLRIKLSDDPSFAQLLEQVRETTLGATTHQDTPLEKIVEALNVVRDTSRTPLFQTTFSLHSLSIAGSALTNLNMDLVRIDNGTAKFDLSLIMAESAHGLIATFEYNTGLFEAATINRMLKNLEVLLGDIAGNPQQRLSQLSILSEAERHQLLVAWNETHTAYPADACIHELFEEQAQSTPDAIAVVFEEKQLTYRELNARANQLARHLQKRGVGPEVRVALCVERSLEMMVALLGILKAGGAYAPIDPNYPAERKQYLLKDLQAPILLGQSHLLGDVLPTESWTQEIQVVCLDSDWSLIEQEDTQNLLSQSTGSQLAYVMYTSGSTGQPKGVCIPHRGVVRLVKGTEYSKLDSEQLFLQLAPLAFDASTFEIWGSLLHGARLIIFAPHTPTPNEIEEFARRHNITTLWLTAGLFQQVIDLCPGVLEPLQQLLVGGDVLSVPHVQKATRLLNGRPLINGYGPTENTTFTCCYRITAPYESTSSVPIGRPIANTQIYVLDPQLQPVPIGVPGELYIGGDGLACGYLNQPDLTAEKFIPHPFSDESQARLYRTGDRVRYCADGNLQFLGRLDDQVKIRGFRIEPGEVEAVLQQHQAVREAVVVAHEDEGGDKRLVAYLVPHEGQTLSTSELRRFAQDKLPDYMVPSTFMFLEALPLSTNGKVNRKALPLPDALRSEYSFVPPRTPVETVLAEIWADVLRVEKVGAHDNFFELGGHSLLAGQVISRACQVLQLKLPLRSLFESPTVVALARQVEAIQQGELASPTEPVPPLCSYHQDLDSQCVEVKLPLSFTQQRLWFLAQLEPDTYRYNIPQAVQLSGELQVEKLQQSLDTIVARHASLRTTFTIEDGSPMQVIAPAQSVNLPTVDLSDLSEEERETEARRLAAKEGRQPFDLTRGPLMRVQLLRLAHDHYILLLTMHHIISDGWSIAVFFRELGALYNALIEDKPSPLAELPIQYADFTLWQRSYLQGQELQNQLAYWKQQLADAPAVLELPSDYPRPLTTGEPGSKAAPAILHDLGAELTQRVKALSQREGVTLFMTLIAAFKALLHHYTGQDDIVVGSPIAGRNHTETEDCIGAFVNTLVLRTKLEGNPTFRELLKREREVALGAYAHQEMPFEKLLEELQPQRSLHHTPLFQVFFNMLNLPPVHADLPGLVTEHLALPSPPAKFDLTLYVAEQKGNISLRLVYDSELFHAETIQRMAAHFQTLLEGVVANADLRLSQLPLLTESERLQRSTPVNRISPRNEFIRWSQQETYSTLYRRFEQQVERNPRQIAVKTTSHQWSYDELNQRANHIAHSILSRCGDGKGDEPQRVALLFEHGAPMIAAILGVLKAGKTYVPLEPAHPQERLALIVVDVQATAIVTNNSHLALAAALAADILHLINADDVEDAVVASDAVTVDSSPHDAAYILYTSGSTGKPKGVVQSHRNVLGHIRNYSNNLHIRSDDRLTLFSSYGFDAAVMDIFAALLNGATFYPIDVKEHGVASLSRYLSEQEITIFHSTPTLYRYFMSTLPVGETLRHLRLVVLGGEEVVRTDVELYKKHCSSDCLFVNGFGPTEATVVLQNFIDHQTPLTRHAVPIGYPVEDSEILLLNKDGEEVELFGEITVRSPHVALGYWQEPKLTRAVFPPDPAQGDKRIYRTGDLGRRLANGAIEFVGRKDFQVKIRGHRIELREIESVVSRHPSVREAVVMAQRNGLGEAGLVAYVVGVDEAVLSGSQLRQFTQTKLPDYMVPGTFVLLDKMPLIENGKIDRQALLRLPQEEGDCPQTPARPQNELEGQLIESWKKVLNRQQIGVRDNFFDLGGHSLLAVSLVASIEQEFGCKLSLGTLFQMPTVERLASFITQQVHQEHQTTPSRSLVAIQPRGSKQPLFMVHDASGTLWCYHALAQYMGTDQPVYGFQVPVVHDNSHLPRTVDSIAARYVDELCEFQPQGPYFLGGFSLGGALAFEMAQQLREQGREVALLALLDTGCPGAHRETATPLQTAQLYLRNLRSMNRHDALMHVSSRVLRKAPKGTPVSLDELADESIREALFESATQHQLPQAFNSYEVRSYAGGVVLFRASLHFRGFDDSLGWQRVAKGELRVEFVPGSHATMVMEPHVRHLAARLKLHINSAQSSQVA